MAISKKLAERLIVALTSDKYGQELCDTVDELISFSENAEGRYESKFVEHSVNQSRTRLSTGGSELAFIADKKHTGAVSGNLNGGGSGNKPIAGIRAFQKNVGKKFSEIDLVISEDVEIRTKETIDDADEDKLGMSYNMLVDVEGNGVEADYRVFVITNTLTGDPDKWGEIGASASVDDFNIKTDNFYVVLGLSGVDGGWVSTLVTWNDVVSGYPNAKIISDISVDGGHPAGEKLAALQAQIGGSSNALRSITVITRLEVNGEKII